MRKQTTLAVAQCMPAEDEPEQDAQFERFEKIYSDWLAARAAHEAPSSPQDADDALNQRAERSDEAARLLFITPASRNFQVWKKIEAFEYYLFHAAVYGDWTDRRQISYFGCIKADLVRLGIGGRHA